MGSIWVANITTANSSDVITVSYADSTYKGNIICHQYTNLDLTNPVDAGSEVQATTTTGSATSMTSPSFNTASANEVIFVFGVTAVVAVQTFTPGTNYTLRGLDYNADGPPPNDIEQQAAVEDWQPGVTETGTTASISWTNASDAQILVVGLKGLTGTTSATTRRVVNLQ
jgi:hypothetical protein